MQHGTKRRYGAAWLLLGTLVSLGFCIPPAGALAQGESASTTNASSLLVASTIYIAPIPASTSYSTSRAEGQFSLFLGVPFAVSDDDDLLSPGFYTETRWGAKVGLWSPELNGGWQGQWADQDQVGGHEVKLTSWWFGLGLRLEGDNASDFTPYTSVAFDFTFWKPKGAESMGCEEILCEADNSFAFNPGFSGKVGINYRVGPYFGLDIGMRWSMVFPTNGFVDSEWWITPYLAFSVYI